MERLRDFNEKKRNGFISAVIGAALGRRGFQRAVVAGRLYCFLMRLMPRLRAGSDAYPGWGSLFQRASCNASIPLSRSNEDPTAPTTQFCRLNPTCWRMRYTDSIPVQCA